MFYNFLNGDMVSNLSFSILYITICLKFILIESFLEFTTFL